jgi:hypothetical protein
MLLGAAALASPVPATRLLGMDSATAKRVTLLARMAGARDVSLGAGTLAAGTLGPAGRAGTAWWLVAGAFADAVDAAAMAAALRRGTVRGLPAAGIAVGAAVSAGIALRAAVAIRRGAR